MDQYSKLKRQPLKVVLAEFRFSQVLMIAGFIPKMQEALRQTYPTVEQLKDQAVQVQPGGIQVQTVDRWVFLSADRKKSVDITQDRLVFSTAKYDRFDGFSNSCRQALEALKSIVNPGLIHRVGLRYCDMDEVEAGQDVSKIVDSSFSFPRQADSLGSPQLARKELSYTTQQGLLMIRALYGNNNLVCMPDMQNLPINIESSDTPSERIILDFDHVWEPTNDAKPFETHQVIEELDKLHKTSREAFWAITTDYARNEKWS